MRRARESAGAFHFSDFGWYEEYNEFTHHHFIFHNSIILPLNELGIVEILLGEVRGHLGDDVPRDGEAGEERPVFFRNW
jgi:hypothetical protein